VLRIAQGGRGRVTRNKRAQDAAALLALASGSGVTQAQD
jgi:hypothetical protein